MKTILLGEIDVPESVAHSTPGESADIAEGSVKFQNAPNSVARDTSGEFADVDEGSVQSQGGESSKGSDDDFEDIMDVASFGVDVAYDIETHAVTKTYKRWKRPKLSNVTI
ncbi:hypothetical protein K7X08_026209 [Anisodus acutangulus]|uniref:Uncharacterized protein n=1 Tax=Anisodus acutangulus TaxID=402998 RepID=A0A9Q1N843_9SOLA|nr:hypothetical protein K7X08_026209 [Anisodus acutangulus]